MIKAIEKTLRSYLAQYTTIFDITNRLVSVKTTKNVISSPGLVGKVTFSGATAGNASIGALNDTFDFVAGQCVTDIFFGDTEVDHGQLTAHELNVGTAFDRDSALKIMQNTTNKNSVIVYKDSTVGDGTIKHSISANLQQKITQTIGIMFKAEASQIDSLGLDNMEALYVNSIVPAQTHTSSIPMFRRINDRFFVDSHYVIDLIYEYEDYLVLNDKFIASLKYFDAKLGDVKVTLKKV